MSNHLTRLITRTLGMTRTAKPIILPMFAQVPGDVLDLEQVQACLPADPFVMASEPPSLRTVETPASPAIHRETTTAQTEEVAPSPSISPVLFGETSTSQTEDAAPPLSPPMSSAIDWQPATMHSAGTPPSPFQPSTPPRLQVQESQALPSPRMATESSTTGQPTRYAPLAEDLLPELTWLASSRPPPQSRPVSTQASDGRPAAEREPPATSPPVPMPMPQTAGSPPMAAYASEFSQGFPRAVPRPGSRAALGPQLGRESTGTSPQPPVHVRIGRVDVRAIIPQSAPVEVEQVQLPRPTLADYLKRLRGDR
jgi:hypothetical protein